MLYGIAITGTSPDDKRKALIAAIDVMRKDLLAGSKETVAFFSQPGPLVLYVKPAKDDPASAQRLRPGSVG